MRPQVQVLVPPPESFARSKPCSSPWSGAFAVSVPRLGDLGLRQAQGTRSPTGHGSVCIASIEGAAFTQVREDVRTLLTTGPDSAPVELTRDSYGYSWLNVQRDPGDLAALV